MKSIVKKVLLSLILVAIVVGAVLIGINASKGKKEQKISAKSSTVEKVAQEDENNSSANQNANNNQAVTDNNSANTQKAQVTTQKEVKQATETKLNDGIEYSVTSKEIKPDIVMKDNYYDTQIMDFNNNFDQYEGKTIQIEGLYFENEAYTFIGRYSTSNLCQYCPVGYSFFEYEWHGDKKPELKDSDTWIKIIGTLRKGNDGVEYYYIDADSIEVMNEKGQLTVSN